MDRAVVWLLVLWMVVSFLFFGLAHAGLLTLLIVVGACYWLWRRFGRG